MLTLWSRELGASLQFHLSSHLEPDTWSCGLGYSGEHSHLEFFMPFPERTCWLGVAGDKRTKMSRILSLASGRLWLAMFWEEPPPL